MIKQEWPNDMCPRCGRSWSMCQCKRKRKGFSFVEVIICVSILIILCALLYPAFIAFKNYKDPKNYPIITDTMKVEKYETKRLDINTDISTIIIDNEKYIIVRSHGAGISICPAVSKTNIKELKPEKEMKND